MINVIIVDSAAESDNILTHLLRDEKDINLLGVCNDTDFFFEKIMGETIDIVFIWLESSPYTSIYTAKRIKYAYPEAKVVFCSDSSKYAVDAFEIEASDYLLSPPSSERLHKTLSNIIKHGKKVMSQIES